MKYKNLDRSEYRNKENWRLQPPLEIIVKLRGGFELIKEIELGVEIFKGKYNVFDVDNKKELNKLEITYFSHDDNSKKEMRKIFQIYDILPGCQWGLFVSVNLLKCLITDYIPESILEHEKFWRDTCPSHNNGLVYFSSDDKNKIIPVVQKMNILEKQEFMSIVDSVLDINSENKMHLLFDNGEKGNLWKRNAKKYCRDLLSLIKMNNLEVMEKYDESEIKKFIRYYVSKRVNDETARKIYFDSIPFMIDLIDFYLEKMK